LKFKIFSTNFRIESEIFQPIHVDGVAVLFALFIDVRELIDGQLGHDAGSGIRELRERGDRAVLSIGRGRDKDECYDQNARDQHFQYLREGHAGTNVTRFQP
jgi:hypothetical protein